MKNILKSIVFAAVLLLFSGTGLAYNYIIVVDVSGSMQSNNFAPDVRDYLANSYFPNLREGDRLQLITFGTQVNLIMDEEIGKDITYLKEFARNLKFEEDFTYMTHAIDMAFASAKRFVEANETEPVFIVLFTDGKNDPPENVTNPITFEQIKEKYGLLLDNRLAGMYAVRLGPIQEDKLENTIPGIVLIDDIESISKPIFIEDIDYSFKLMRGQREIELNLPVRSQHSTTLSLSLSEPLTLSRSAIDISASKDQYLIKIADVPDRSAFYNLNINAVDEGYFVFPPTIQLAIKSFKTDTVKIESQIKSIVNLFPDNTAQIPLHIQGDVLSIDWRGRGGIKGGGTIDFRGGDSTVIIETGTKLIGFGCGIDFAGPNAVIITDGVDIPVFNVWFLLILVVLIALLIWLIYCMFIRRKFTNEALIDFDTNHRYDLYPYNRFCKSEYKLDTGTDASIIIKPASSGILLVIKSGQVVYKGQTYTSGKFELSDCDEIMIGKKKYIVSIKD